MFNPLHDLLLSWQHDFRSRAIDMKALADRLAFDNFEPEPNPDFPLAWSFLTRLSKGENRFAFNILQGTYHGEKLFIFDYHYETVSNKKSDDIFSTIFMLITAQYFPKITIGPENVLGKIEGVFDSHDIKFESAEFSRAFRVRCADKKFAYDVCNPQMIDYLLANRDLEIELHGPIISLSFTPPLRVNTIEAWLQEFAQVRALLPQYLFDQNNK
jgi:hypothetical protein